MNFCKYFFACLVASLLATTLARADGGVPIASVETPSGRCTLIMLPAQPSVGSVTFTLLGDLAQPPWLQMQDASQNQPISAPMQRDSQGNAWHVSTTFSNQGECVVSITAHGETLMQTSMQVQAAPPAWQSQLPWILCWMPVFVVLALRQWALVGRLHTVHDATR